MAGTKARHKRVTQFKSNQEIMDTLTKSYTDMAQPPQPAKEHQATDIAPSEEALPEEKE